MPDESVGTNRELLIGLIAPIGVDLNNVQRSLEAALATVHYRSTSIRLTDRLKPNHKEHTSAGTGLYDRYVALIDQGNTLRANSVPDIFSLMAIFSIVEERMHQSISTNDRHAFIVRQFKRPEEVSLLKRVYGSTMILVSCYAPKSNRIRYFSDKFQSEARSINRTKHESQALDLISMDEHQPNNDNGQRLLDTYAKADFIIDCSSPQKLALSSSRFIQAFFGDPFISPSRNEYGAFIENAASLRSTDLSRQVGAAIFQPAGEVVALGCNEVPKAGGGTYWTGDNDDARDHQLALLWQKHNLGIPLGVFA